VSTECALYQMRFRSDDTCAPLSERPC
jgi:hypothetical protein